MLVAALALLASGCGDNKKSAAKHAANPQEAVKTSLVNASKVKSGEMKYEATFSGGGMPGSMKISGDGVFDMEAKGGAAMHLTMAFDIAGQKQEMGFTMVDGKSYMEVGGQAMSMGDASGSTASTGKIDKKQIDEMFKALEGMIGEVKPAGTATVNGETVTVYSTTVDVTKAADEVEKQAKGNLPSSVPGFGDLKSLAKMFSDTKVRVGVDSDDLPRLVEFETSFNMGAMGGATGASGSGSGGFKVRAELTKANTPVTIEKPKNVVEGKGALDALGGMFGGMGATN